METSHPKVWRYIRALTKEIGIIVLGVLLALGAGQLVELMYWSHLTRQTEHQMRGELTDASKFAFERIAFGPCLEQRLLDLDTRLGSLKGIWRAESGTHPMPELNALHTPYVGILRPWADTIWQTALASNALAHMKSESANAFASNYHLLAEMRKNNEAEQADIPNVMPLGVDRRFTPDAADRVGAALDDLRFRNAFSRVTSRQLYQRLQKLGISPSASDKANILAYARHRFGACLLDPDAIKDG